MPIWEITQTPPDDLLNRRRTYVHTDTGSLCIIGDYVRKCTILDDGDVKVTFRLFKMAHAYMLYSHRHGGPRDYVAFTDRRSLRIWLHGYGSKIADHICKELGFPLYEYIQ